MSTLRIARSKMSHQEASPFPAKVYDDALDEVIEKHFGPSHKDCTVTISAGSAKGDNYGGDVFRVTVKHPTQETLSVIVKQPPQNQARREQFMSADIFGREAEFYDTIIRIFTDFQTEKGIDVKKDGFHEVARCYKTLTDAPNEGLILEDIKVGGFEMFDRFKDLTADHVFRVMETLGKLHAISLALKDQRPEVMAPYKEMVDVWCCRDEKSMKVIADWFESLKKQGMELLGTFTNPDLIERTKQVLVNDILTILKSLTDGASAEPHAVLCHGDCWNNNMMFREENGVPIECCLLDWQILRYASPICDLCNYIFGGTTKELRDKHYHQFLDVYYESLSGLMRRLGSDPAKVFSREAFDDQLKRFGKFGLVMAIISLPVTTSKVAVDMDEMCQKAEDDDGTADKQPEISESYVRRMTGVFQDMYDFGYI